MKNKISGVYVPMVTPFKEDESLDEQAIREHVDFLIANGIDGLIPCGSTGEFIAMDDDERRRVLEIVVDQNRGRVEVYASTGHYSTKKTLELSRHAEQSGATGLMVITPYYLRRDEIELYEHYKAIRDAVTIPIMMYHNPHFSATTLSDEFMAKCYLDGLISSLKEGEGDVFRLVNIRSMTDDGLALFYGFDACVIESLSMAADGWVAGTANLIPAEDKQVYDLVVGGRIDEARELWYRIKKFIDLCMKPTDEGLPAPWLSVLKEGLRMRNQNGGYPRRPTMPLSASVRVRLRQVLKDLGHIAD